MSERSYRLPPLHPDEEIMYEGPTAVLTSHRLMANFGRKGDGSFEEAPLTDIGVPKKYNGGKDSQRYSGTRLLGIGAVVLVVEFLIESAFELNDKIAALLFLVGTLVVTAGMYLIIGGMFQVKPNTTLVFPKLGGGQIVVPFVDWDNPDAEELTRQFARAKRGF